MQIIVAKRIIGPQTVEVRITVDIAETDLAELLKLTGERKKSSAVSKVVTDYLNRKRAREFGRLLREGDFDFPSTNEEIEKRDI